MKLTTITNVSVDGVMQGLHLAFRLPCSDTYADRVAVEVRLLRA
jgi:hypothetical protein